MKILLSIIALASVFTASAQTSQEAEFLKLSEAKLQYQLAKNWGALSDMFDENIIIQHSRGNIQTKAEYFKNLQDGDLIYNKADVYEKSVKIFDKTAVVMGKVKFNVTFQGKLADFDFMFTEVYAQQGKKWKLVLHSMRKNGN